jgi:hypothetical protein
MSDKRPVPLRFIAAFLLFGMALLTAKTAHAQVGVPGPQSPFPQPIGPRVGGGIDDRSDLDLPDTARRVRALNDMRQKQIVSDTNKLLKLANELDAEIHKENSDSLTPEQLRKLATIEKLARNVKEHMSTPVTGLPDYQQPTVPLLH